MRKILGCIIFLILIMLSVACSNSNQRLQLEYNNVLYEPVNHWRLIDDSHINISVTLKGDNKKYSAYLYSNADKRFILAGIGLGDVLFHKINEPLPSYEKQDKIEKVNIDFYDNKYKDVILQHETLEGLIIDINAYNQKKQRDNNLDNLGVVDIYYENYPAYQFCGHIVKTKEGKLGFYKLDSNSSGKINEYILLSNQNIFN